MFGKKKREQTDKMVQEKFREIRWFCESLDEQINWASPHFCAKDALKSCMDDLVEYTRDLNEPLKQMPFYKVMTALLAYYGDQLPFTDEDLKSLARDGLGCVQKVGYNYKYVYNYTKKEVDNCLKVWQEMQPHLQTLMDVCEEFHYDKHDGKFKPVAGDEKRCALVEKSLRETFEGLFGKEIDEAIEKIKQNGERNRQEKIAQQKEAEERRAKEKEERTERINAKFGIGKEK